MSKRHILPIFLLYFLTSIAFLAFFGYLFYEREKGFLLEKDRILLRQIRHDFQTKLKFGSLTDSDLSEFNATIKPIKKGHFHIQNSDINGTLRHFVIFDRFQDFLVTITADDLSLKFYDLKVKILLALCVILGFILLIAYFIIRLSLRPLYEKIEFLNRFLRDTTHEINTPLSVILMSIEMFEANPKKYLKNIKTAALTISNLYDDLVEFSLKKDEAKTLVDLSSLIDERFLYFSDKANQKGLKISSNLHKVKILTQKFKFRKIVDNLISNAIKYSDENSEILAILDENSFMISNSGLGIKKENLAEIFKPYTRFDEQNGGFGIGLSLVKNYSDELGFQVDVKSENGLTTFTLWFNKNF
ncbi:sensor histidine kinase [Campylobacter mucosalis]|uniref:sensor histidine kinase n=1 Tax=Campylobacter mucosalis TaxID=202 RepID=UPI0014703D22|nr:HAMP domain-containing sensor histidine kinase [Campylobacter mucosalis]